MNTGSIKCSNYLLRGAIVAFLALTFVTQIPQARAGTPTTPILRQFLAPIAGNGRAIAFNGTDLFYTLTPGTNIYVIDGTGRLVKTITSTVSLGALSWHGNQLWGGAYDGTGRVFTINASGAVTLQFTFSFPSGDTCFSQAPGNIDGLAVMSDGTLWISDDAGQTAWHVSATGTILSSHAFGSFTFGSSTFVMCNTGIAFDGTYLWFALYPLEGNQLGTWDAIISRYTQSLSWLWSFRHDGLLYEGITYDGITFAPNCAIWAISGGGAPSTTVTAFQVPCTPTAPALHNVAITGVWPDPMGSVPVGTIVTINAIVLNNGSSTENTKITLSVNNQMLFSQNVTILPGQIIDPHQPFMVPSVGTFTPSTSASFVDKTVSLNGPSFSGCSPCGSGAVGGIVLPIDRLALLTPLIGLASLIVAATIVTAVYVRRPKRREAKQ